MFVLKFRDEDDLEDTRVIGLSYSEDLVIVVAWVVLTWHQRVTDGQTDGVYHYKGQNPRFPFSHFLRAHMSYLSIHFAVLFVLLTIAEDYLHSLEIN